MTIQSVFILQGGRGREERVETALPDQGHSGEDGREKSTLGMAARWFSGRHPCGYDYLSCRMGSVKHGNQTSRLLLTLLRLAGNGAPVRNCWFPNQNHFL